MKERNRIQETQTKRQKDKKDTNQKATISINIRPEINNSSKQQTEPKETLVIRGISALRVCSFGATGSYVL